MPYAFLSDEWIDAVDEIRARHAADGAAPPIAVKLNLVVTGAPFGDGDLHRSVDTSSGAPVVERGHLAEPDVTITTDYDTAKSLFLATDPAAGMQAMMAGKLVVQGDMMKLVALPAMATDPAAQAASEEIRSITL
jgi:hypothetical protein